MKQEEVKEILAGLFVPRDKGLEGSCFRREYMDRENEPTGYAVYNIVSNVMRESGLSFNFSYEIAKKVCDILSESEWSGGDIRDSVDMAVPVYNNELLSIYTVGNYWAVDKAREEYGADDVITDAQTAWGVEMEDMAHEIISRLKVLVTE